MMSSTNTITAASTPTATAPVASTPNEKSNPSTSYVFGLPRSGTTLLSYLLAGGDSQLSLCEPYLAFDIFGRWRRPLFFNRLAKKAGLSPPRVPKGKDEKAFAHYLLELASLNGLRHVVIKETFRDGQNWANVELLTRLAASPAGLIVIHRHPYDIAASTLRFSRWWRGLTGRLFRLWTPRLPLFRTDREVVTHVAANWRSFYRWCQPHDMTTIRYEDLVATPEVSLRTACEACRIAFQPQMLDHTHPRVAFGGIGDPGVINQPARPISTQSVGRKKRLAPEFCKVIADRCGTEAALLGYEM